MALLVVFALLAGAGTALTPCVLPVLPAHVRRVSPGGRSRGGARVVAQRAGRGGLLAGLGRGAARAGPRRPRGGGPGTRRGTRSGAAARARRGADPHRRRDGDEPRRAL